MYTLLKKMLPASPGVASNKEIVSWWERRRIYYNLILLVAGSVTIILSVLLGEMIVTDLVNAFPPILVFAFSANLFYTLGWVVEIACRKFIPGNEMVQKIGPVLFIAGVSFSVLFTFVFDIVLLIAFFFGE